MRPNVSRIAQVLGVRQANLWHYMNGRSRWRADEWIKTMICLGYVIESPRAFEIHVPKVKEMCELYDDLEDFNPGDRSHKRQRHDIGEVPGDAEARAEGIRYERRDHEGSGDDINSGARDGGSGSAEKEDA